MALDEHGDGRRQAGLASLVVNKSVLLLNQTFFPDNLATSQYLTELGRELAERQAKVRVITGRQAYDDPGKVHARKEEWSGIEIHRVGSLALGKSAKWKRALNFGTFLVSATSKLGWMPRSDAVVALTSPPLISVLGAGYKRLRCSRFFYWVMDLNPDEAIAAGWLRQRSLAGRFLESASRFSFRQANAIIALDRFMRDRIVAKGIGPDNIHVIPPWIHDDHVRFDPTGRDEFRRRHNLDGKFVVMYSGNHSPCHPLETILEAAKRLAGDVGRVPPRGVDSDVGRVPPRGAVESKAPDAGSGLPAPPRQAGDRAYRGADAGDVGRVPSRGEVGGQDSSAGSGDPAYTGADAGDVGRVPSRGEAEGMAPDAGSGDPAYRGAHAGDIVFCFIGGGSEFPKVQAFARDHGLSNIVCLPYQPLDQLAASLSAADLHLVVMGDPFVGIVHPCKVYNILKVGAPVLYIGPDPSHVTELFAELECPDLCRSSRHGDVNGVVNHILDIRQSSALRLPSSALDRVLPRYSKDRLLSELVDVILSS